MEYRDQNMENPRPSIAQYLIETEFFIMTDVDSISQKDSITIAISRLINEENIGAICGRKTSTPGSHLSSYY